MRKLIVGVVVVASLGLASQASAEGKRFKGCAIQPQAVEVCTHVIVGGEVISLQLIDRREARTPYEVCIKDVVGKDCFDARTGKAGKKNNFFFEPRASGDHVVRWKVDGHQVERWDFELFPGGM